MALIESLPYQDDSSRLFEAVADSPWAVFLDSGRHDPAQSRYDIIAAEPCAMIVTRGGMSEVRTQATTRILPDDPFVLLRALLQPYLHVDVNGADA